MPTACWPPRTVGTAAACAATVLLLSVAALPAPVAAEALPLQQILPGPIVKTFEGVDYNIATMLCDLTGPCAAKIYTTAIYGNATLAEALAALVKMELGVQSPDTGPLFAHQSIYQQTSNLFIGFDAFYWANWLNITGPVQASIGYTWGVALVERVVSPPSPAPPGPPPPGPSPPGPPQAPAGVCTGNNMSIPVKLESVTAIDVKSNDALCALRKKATRKVNPKPAGTVIKVSPFSDAQGNPASPVTFTGAQSNRMAIATCRCGRDCTCVPDAVIAKDSASVRVMPLSRALDVNRRPAGTTVRLFFNATVPATGLSCSGFVDVCARPLLRTGTPTRNSPACGPFEATKAVRDLTVCG